MSIQESEKGVFHLSTAGHGALFSRLTNVIEKQSDLITVGANSLADVLNSDHQLRHRIRAIPIGNGMHPIEKLVRASAHLNLLDATPTDRKNALKSYCYQFVRYHEALLGIPEQTTKPTLWQRLFATKEDTPKQPEYDVRFDLTITSATSVDAQNMDDKMIMIATSLINEPVDNPNSIIRSNMSQIYKSGKGAIRIEQPGYTLELERGVCTWQVFEGNRACERAREHIYAKVLFGVLEELDKNKCVTGKIHYQNDYGDNLILNEYKEPEMPVKRAPGRALLTPTT